MYFSPKYYVPHFPLLNYNLPRADLKRWDLKKTSFLLEEQRIFLLHTKIPPPRSLFSKAQKSYKPREGGELYIICPEKDLR